MKKFGLMLLMSAIMLVCILPMTASAFIFPGLSAFPSTISSGSIWIIIGVLLIVIIAAVAIIVKVKKNKK